MRTKANAGIIALVATCFAAPLFATSPAVTWYVDAKASPGGSGLYPASAFMSVQEAADAASSGDTVRIAAGVYRENVVVDGKSLTIVGAGREATVIDANGSGRPLYLKGGGVAGTRIKSLCLANGRADVGGGLYVDAADVDVGFLDGKITDCVTTGNGAAVNGSAWVVRTLIGCCWSTGDEMAVFTGVKGLFSSVIIGCGRGFVTPISSWSDWTRNHSPILDTYVSGEQIKVVNCTFSNNEGILTRYVNVSGALGNMTVRNCAFFGIPSNWARQNMNIQYSFSSFGGIMANGRNNIGGDNPDTHSGERWPSTHFQIVAPFSDWRPLAGSDLVDSGNSVFVNDLVPEEYRAADYYGNTRIQGGTVDIGAAEGTVEPAGGIVFFPMNGSWASYACATNLWIDGYRAVAPNNLETGGNPRMANGIHFASAEANRAAVLKFAYPSDRPLAIWGFTNQTGTATHPNFKGAFTFVLSGTPGMVETNSLIRAASVKWVSPDGDNGAAGTIGAPYKTLQKAHDASSSCGVVFAKAGTYAEGSHAGTADSDNVNTTLNRLYITKPLCVISENGPEMTVIKGERATGEGTYDGCGSGAMRCVQISTTVANACVCGFTLTGGATDASPIANAKTGKSGDSISRGNFGGSAAQGYVWAKGNVDRLQIVDCIVSNNVSYFGTVYSVVAKNCIFADNRIASADSSGSTVTMAAGAMGASSKFFGCLAYANDQEQKWLTGSGLCLYDSTMIGGKINTAEAVVRNTAFFGGSLPSGNGVIAATREMFADSDNGDFRPVPGSALCTDASSDTLQDDYVKFRTTSLDGMDYTVESGQPLTVGAYRKASAYPATARDWYVDAAKADDSGDGLTSATAKKTLAAVMALVRRGDTVHAARGTYDEGEMTNTVKLISDAAFMGSRVVLPEGVSLVADEGPDVTFIKGRFGASSTGYDEHALRGVYMNENTLLDGFTVTDCQTVSGSYEAENSCGGCIVAPKANVARPAVIRNCRLTNSKARSGAAAYGGVLENCRIDECITSSGGLTYHAKLDNCLVVSTTTSANISVLLKYYGVYNSTIHVKNAKGDADFSQAVTGAPIENTVLFYETISKATTLKNAKNCIICANKSNLTIDGSCSGLIETAAIGDVVDVTTYRPVAGSTAIDAGDMALFTVHPSAFDCGGGQRVYNGAVDIGAYEYAPFAEMASSLARRNVTVIAVDGTATLGDGILLSSGSLEAVWRKGSERARREIDFQVTGNGVLVVMDDTGELGRYMANGIEKLMWSPAETGNKTIRFVYQPAADETSGTGAVITKLEAANQFMINFR